MSNQESKNLTKECLHTALIYLMNKKSFEKITITELVQCSGVSRTAFYRNYSAKEDILIEMRNAFILKLRRELNSDEYLSNRFQWYCKFFQTVKANAVLVSLLLQANMPKRTELFENQIMEEIAPSHSKQEYYEHMAQEGAFLAVMLKWITNGMHESVAFMADFCLNSLKL